MTIAKPTHRRQEIGIFEGPNGNGAERPGQGAPYWFWSQAACIAAFTLAGV
jgi:hypothetical protein